MKKKIKHINLEEIKDPSFLQELSKKELRVLCNDIREFILKNVSETGGHLSSNLGAVELIVALHYVFSSPNDKFIFDVGHQTYTHKILTGRAKEFKNLRKFEGLNGYPSYSESKYDAWESGHSSTSISALEGFLRAKDMGQDIGECLAFIGDSAISSGVSFEALNNLGAKKCGSRPIIILNDNKMGISKSVGALHKQFDKLRSNKFLRGIKNFVKKISITPIRNFFHKINNLVRTVFGNSNTFSSLGFDYFGPYNGNDLSEVIKDLKRAKKIKDRPIVIHFLTKKGLGYEKALNDKVGKFHNVQPFDLETGRPKKTLLEGEHTYTDVVLDTLYKIRGEKRFTIIDPAMVLGDYIERYNREYKDFILDIGISEEHGAVLSSALAHCGEKVVILYYSTFLQRAYDEILNDIARVCANVVIGIDRCGVIGPDGSTHQGIYDLSMLQGMPNFEILMPSNAKETREMFKYALNSSHPIAIRYPKMSDLINLDSSIADIEKKWVKVLDGNVGVCITYGPDVFRIKKIIIENNLKIELINARFIRPMDNKILEEIFNKNRPILVYEQVVCSGSLYSKILEYKNKNSKTSRVYGINICEDTIIEFGDVKNVLDKYGLGDKDILEGLKKLYED